MANCTSCGKELKENESLCHSCNLVLEKYELQLEAITKPDTGKKTKKCPHCNQLFSPVSIRIVFYPEKRAWYKPKPVYSCPVCFKYIKSKFGYLMPLLFAVTVCISLLSFKYFGVYSLIFLFPLYICLGVIGIKQRNDTNEFEVRSI